MHSKQEIITALQSGQPVIVLDAADRENEADLVVPAQLVTVEQVAFLIRHTSGIICVSMRQERLDALELHRLVSDHQSKFNTPFTMPVDFKAGTVGGVSAAERTATIKALIDPATQPADLGRPGHVFPLIAHPDGLAARPGHTEAGMRLMELSGLYPAAVLGEMMNDDGTMMRGEQLEQFATQHNLLMCTISDMMEW